MPQQDAVLAMTGGIDAFDAQAPLDLVWEFLLPAMGSEQLEDTVSHRRLREKLAGLSLPPVQGKSSSPIATRISGRTYKADSNDLHIQPISLHFPYSHCPAPLQP